MGEQRCTPGGDDRAAGTMERDDATLLPLCLAAKKSSSIAGCATVTVPSVKAADEERALRDKALFFLDSLLLASGMAGCVAAVPLRCGPVVEPDGESCSSACLGTCKSASPLSWRRCL